MARNPYIPFNEAIEEIFARFDYGNQWVTNTDGSKGWSLDTYNRIRDNLYVTFNELLDDNDPSNNPDEEWFTILETEYEPVYWSTEGIHVG